jgi:peptidoglycan/xylan/chitin deacetylase (PgdA/CDA1 family)
VTPEALPQRIAEWRGAVDAGHEIGNHTAHHPCSENFPFARERALERYTLEMMRSDCSEADERIAALLGAKPSTFAYPCGQTYVGRGTATQSYVPLVAERYLAARCFAEWAVNDPRYCNLHQLASFDLDERPLPYIEQVIERTVRSGGWTVFAGHEIGDGSARQTTGETALVEAIARIQSMPQRIWIDTVAAVAGHVAGRRTVGSV